MKLTSGLIGAEVKGPIGWLIWDNPTKLNALSPGMYEDALSVIADYAADPAVKVVVMRGAGRKAFISGADIKSFETTRANAETVRLARKLTLLRRERLDETTAVVPELNAVGRVRWLTQLCGTAAAHWPAPSCDSTR